MPAIYLGILNSFIIPGGLFPFACFNRRQNAYGFVNEMIDLKSGSAFAKQVSFYWYIADMDSTTVHLPPSKKYIIDELTKALELLSPQRLKR